MDRESTKWIRFLSGKNLPYTLTILCLVAVTIFSFNTVSFIFKPIFIILSVVLGPVLFDIILLYLLNPMVKRLEEKIPCVWVIAVLYVLIIALLMLAGLQLFPIVQDQAEELVKQFPSFWKSTLQTVQEFMTKTPFARDLKSTSESINQLWGKPANSFKDFVGDYLQTSAQGLGSVFSAIPSTFLTLFTGPIIAFFLLKDKEKFYRFVKGITPPAFRSDFDEYSQIVNIQIGDYLKGQIIASSVLGIMYWPAFLLIGLQFGSILALAAGILCITPYVGPFIAFIPGLIIAFQDSTFIVVKFVIVWFAIQLIHGDLVIPRVMGDKLKVHPITILLVLLAVGELFGLMGVIFGTPMYYLIKVAVIYLFRKFKQRYSRFYGDSGEYEYTNFTKDQYLK